MNNWEGIEIEENESPSKMIKIWEIDPHPDPNYDVLWERDYHKMQDYAREALYYGIDSCTEEQMLNDGYGVKVKLRKVKLSHYKEVVGND